MAIAQIDNTTAAISAETLYQQLLENRAPFILDVRNEEAVARWQIEGRDGLERINIPYFDFIEDEDSAVAQLPTDRAILVVCAKEGSSQFVAELLQARGIEAQYLAGGMPSWGNLYDVAEVVSTSAGKIVQVARPARGDLSFMLISDGEAAVIDPLRHIDHYLNVATSAEARITHVFDTHAHADHISGGAAISAETGAPYFLHPYDGIHPIDMLPATLPYTPLQDGQTFQVGQFEVTAIWFPGHTLGQVNYLVRDPDGSSVIFTGDGIFLRSFGRPDLGGQGEAWTPILYESLFERLPSHVSADTLVLPAHFSTLDEADEQGVVAAPYSWVKANNDGLKPRTSAEFTKFVLSHLPTFPPEYVEIKRVNAGLVQPDEETASELELGKNICALSGE